MARLQQALLLCNIAAWALLAPVGWWLSARCPGQAEDGAPAAARRLEAPWARAVAAAVEQGLRDAGAEARELSPELSPEFHAGIRALVAAHVARRGVAKNCSSAHAPVPVPPQKALVLPVLDTLGGKVNASSPAADAAGEWGIPMPNVTVEVAPGRILTVDEIVYGYDLLFEAMHLFSYVSWGRVPMQQDPNDALLIADLIGRIQPDCFVELGTNTGGGAIFYAEAMRSYAARPLVVTIDVHEPTKNWDRFAAKACPHCMPVTCHPTWQQPGLISFVQGFSQDPAVLEKVGQLLDERRCRRTIVMHDSDHRRATVFQDTQVYQRFVQPGSYLIVQDTKLSRMRGGRYSTMQGVSDFLASDAGKDFVIDKTFEYLLFSHHHNGFLQRVK